MGRMVAARRPKRPRQTYTWGSVYVTPLRRLSAPLSPKFARHSLPSRTLLSKVIPLGRSCVTAARPALTILLLPALDE